MKVTIEGKTYHYYPKILNDLDKIIMGREHIALADALKTEIVHMPFEQLCYTDSVYQQATKVDARGMGPLSQVELAVQLTKFVMYFDPTGEYNSEGPKRVRNRLVSMEEQE